MFKKGQGCCCENKGEHFFILKGHYFIPNTHFKFYSMPFFFLSRGNSSPKFMAFGKKTGHQSENRPFEIIGETSFSQH